jgi:hypothetical protein
MKPNYHNSNVQVLAGDHIEFKTRTYFLRSWVSGRVHYVSGQSLQSGELEKDNFVWVAIQHGEDKRISVLVISETGHLSHLVRFVKRADERIVQSAQDHAFGD